MNSFIPKTKTYNILNNGGNDNNGEHRLSINILQPPAVIILVSLFYRIFRLPKKQIVQGLNF